MHAPTAVVKWILKKNVPAGWRGHRNASGTGWSLLGRSRQGGRDNGTDPFEGNQAGPKKNIKILVFGLDAVPESIKILVSVQEPRL